ncbi:hypothetical protein [Brevibacillus laterosporus]|nr:hypothetical protein [Brevibacillus laterosporus]MDN9009839.1 hypothetical protein [Brevibacillus laterosporus]MDO0940779.1 hypothetical protein [Brevibacillus laterosporus]
MSNLINDKNIQAFLNKICEQIKAKEVHHEIRLEMENHLLDIIKE